MKPPFIYRSRRGSYRRIGNQYFFNRLPHNFLLKEDLPPAIQLMGDSIVRVQAREPNYNYDGTGVNLGEVVLTALHTVQYCKNINLVHKEQSTKAREVARDPGLDLALLEPENSLPAPNVVFPTENGLGDGELYAFGYLFFIKARKGRSTTYKERLCAYRIEDTASRVIEGDEFAVAIPTWAYDFFPGFSGGVLVDGDGSIRGVTQMRRKTRNLIFGVTPISLSACIMGLRSRKLQDFVKRYNNGRA